MHLNLQFENLRKTIWKNWQNRDEIKKWSADIFEQKKITKSFFCWVPWFKFLASFADNPKTFEQKKI